jgi:hypothetical protein
MQHPFLDRKNLRAALAKLAAASEPQIKNTIAAGLIITQWPVASRLAGGLVTRIHDATGVRGRFRACGGRRRRARAVNTAFWGRASVRWPGRRLGGLPMCYTATAVLGRLCPGPAVAAPTRLAG